MSDSASYTDREAGRLSRTQPGSDSAPGIAPRPDPASATRGDSWLGMDILYFDRTTGKFRIAEVIDGR